MCVKSVKQVHHINTLLYTKERLLHEEEGRRKTVHTENKLNKTKTLPCGIQDKIVNREELGSTTLSLLQNIAFLQ